MYAYAQDIASLAKVIGPCRPQPDKGPNPLSAQDPYWALPVTQWGFPCPKLSFWPPVTEFMNMPPAHDKVALRHVSDQKLK